MAKHRRKPLARREMTPGQASLLDILKRQWGNAGGYLPPGVLYSYDMRSFQGLLSRGHILIERGPDYEYDPGDARYRLAPQHRKEEKNR